MTIFQTADIFGCHHTMGKASGPTQRKARMTIDVRKYQGGFSPGSGGGRVPFRNSPQCLHLMAASWISSAQYGHLFKKNLGAQGYRNRMASVASSRRSLYCIPVDSNST